MNSNGVFWISVVLRVVLPEIEREGSTRAVSMRVEHDIAGAFALGLVRMTKPSYPWRSALA